MQNKVIFYDNSRAFLEEVGEVLYSRETINNLILGVSERLVMDPQAYQNPFFASVNNENGKMLLASVMTPPHPMILAGGKHFASGLSALIPYLQRNGITLPGVIGPAHISEEFEKIWRQCTRQSGKIRMNQRVYELRTVHLPPLPEGQFRIAIPQDSRKVAAWLQAFSQEALGEAAVSEEERAQSLIREGQVFVWENNSEAVSMALKTRPIAHSITVSGVYTPPKHRRQGYASALVARLSQHLLDSGYKFINLFTDHGNPTSNSIYRKIGYHPVCDFRMVTFQGD